MAHQHPHPGPGDDDYLASKFRKVGQHLIVELFEKKEFKAFHTLPDGTTEFQIHQWRLDREKEVYNAFIIERLPSGGILQPASEPLSKISRNFAHNGRDMPHWIYREMDSTRARYWRQHNAALRAVGQPLDIAPENSQRSGRSIPATENGARSEETDSNQPESSTAASSNAISQTGAFSAATDQRVQR